MRIAYVSPLFWPHSGGVETHLRETATRVAAEGHDVEVLAQEEDPRLPGVEKVGDVTVRRFQVPRLFRAYPFAPALWAYLARHADSWDLVHAHNYHGFPALGAALFTRSPLIFTPHFHGTGNTRLGRMLHVPYRHPGRLMFQRARRVICVSRAEADLVEQHFAGTGSRTVIIPNGVDVEEFRAASPLQIDHTVLLTVGRLKMYKNVQRAVQALQYLEGDVHLHVVGDGPAKAALADFARRLGLGDRTHLMGHVDDASLRRWYRTAALYLSMSSQEAFGITLLEALAAGTPVLASDIPAHREVAELAGSDSVHLVSENLSAMELAQNMRDVISAGRPSLQHASVPTWAQVAARTLDVYRSVLDETGAHGPAPG